MIFPVTSKKSRKIKPLERALVFRSDSVSGAYIMRRLHERSLRRGGEGPSSSVFF